MRLIDADLLQEKAICGGSENGFIPIKRLWEAQTIELPVVHGKWICKELHDACSNCGFRHYTDCEYNFCPECGTDMREDRND